MRKNWKRLLALFLATAMVIASGVFTTYTPFDATSTDAYTENLDESTELVELTGESTEESDLLEEDGTVETTEELQVVEEGEEAPDAALEETSEEASEEEALEESDEAEATEEEAVAKGDATETVEEESTVEEDADAEEEEEEEEEISYPAVSFAKTTATGVQVTIDAPEGAFPVGTTVTVADVTSEATLATVENLVDEDKVVTSVVAVDITFRDKDGNEIEPKSAIAVRIMPPTALAGEEFSVVHVEDNGNATVVEDNGADASGASFRAEEFSTYVVMGTETARVLQEGEYEIAVDDDPITIYSTSTTISSKSWSTSSDAVGLSSKDYSSVKVTANYEGTATITHGSGSKKETFTVYVKPYEETCVLEVGEGKEVPRLSSSETASSDDTSVISVTNTYRWSGAVSRTYYADCKALEPGRATVTVKNGSKVYAKYYFIVTGIKTVRVSFNGGNNSVTGSIEDIVAEIPEGETSTTVTMPEGDALSYTKYMFLGWADAANATEPKYYPGEEVELTASKTFYAVWKKVGGQIQFMKLDSMPRFSYSADGDAITVEDLNAEYTITKAHPTLSNYTFYGWSAQVVPNGSYAFTVNRGDFIPKEQTVIVPKNYMKNTDDELKLYPVFVYNNAGLTIAVRKDGKIPQEPNVNGDPYYYFVDSGGAKVTKYLNAPYAYWGNDENMRAMLKDEMFNPDRTDEPGNIYTLNPRTNSELNLDLEKNFIEFYICKYQYNDKTYHLDGTKRDRERAYLDYDVNGGLNKPESQTTDVGGTLTVSSTKLSATVEVSRTGYKFKEWNTKKDGTGTAYAPGSSITLTTDLLDENHHVILYAQWIPNDNTAYTVQWIDRYDDSVIQQESRHGITASMASVQTADESLNGYIYDAGNAGEVRSGRIAADGSLILKLYFYQNVTISYEDTMDSGVAMPADATVEKGQNHTVQGNAADFANKITGYSFVGWATSASATAAEYQPGQEITNVLTNMKLYAIWQQTGTIRYGYNLVLPEATWSVPAGFTAENGIYYNSVAANSGDTFTVTANKPSAGGYEFVGWADRSAGALRNANDQITITREVVLEALWVKTTGNNDRVTYDGATHTLDTFQCLMNTADDGYVTISRVSYAVAGTTYDALPAFKNAGEYNYIVTYVVNGTSIIRTGTLTIDKANVTVTGANAEKDYDGKPLKADVVKPQMTARGFFGEDAITEYTYSGSQTLVGSSAYTVEAAAYSNDQVVNNYNIAITGGRLIVKGTDAPRYQITLSGTNDSAPYNGEDQEHSGITASGNLILEENNSFVNRLVTSFTGNVTYTFSVTDEANGDMESYTIKVKENSIKVSGKDAGSYDYTPEILSIVDSNNNNAADLFSVTANKGIFTINPAPLDLESAGGEKVYDGTELTNDSVTVSGLVNNETLTATATGSITYPGQTANTIQLTWDKTAKEANYYIRSKTEGKLIITSHSNALPLSITANSGTKYYSGKAQNIQGFEGATTRTIGGESVTAVPATINLGGTNQTYYVVGATAVAEGTDAGTYDTVITTTDAKVYDEDNQDVTSEFKVVGTDGTLTINKRQVTITSASAEKTYDGTELRKEEIASITAYDENGKGFVAGEGVASYEYSYEDGHAIYAGDVKRNTFTYTLNKDTKADNYEITKVAGTLTINSAAGAYKLTVTAKNITSKYDGTIQTKVNEIENLGTDGRIKATYNNVTYYITGYSAKAEGKNAGGYVNALTGTDVKVYDANGQNVTENFSITPVNGTFTITKRNVTLTGKPLSKAYNGTPLEPTDEDVTVGGDGWAEGEGVTYQFSGTQTLVGQSNYTFTYAQWANTDLATNYNITATGSTLEVTINENLKYQITVGGPTETYTYDGAVHEISGFTVNGTNTSVSLGNWISNNLTNANELSRTFELSVGGQTKTFTISIPKAKVTASQTDAGTKTYGWDVSDIQIKDGTQDVTNQFAITLTGGSVAVTKRPVTMTSATDSKAYDGTPLTNDTVTVSGDGFVAGEGATYNVTGTVTDPNQSVENTFTYTLNDGTKAGNYDITTVAGTLSITPRDTTNLLQATITANGLETKYDGSAKSVSGFVGEENGIVEVEASNGLKYKVSGYTVGASGTDAGEYTTSYTGTLKVESLSGADVTDQFNVTVVPGTLKIQKRNIKLTSATDSKTYDGNPLTKHEIIVSGDDGYAPNEVFTYNFTGSQVIAGSSENTFTYADGTAKAANYNVTTSFGSLTVTNRTGNEQYAVTITAGSGEYEYDGAEKVVNTFAEGTRVNDDGDVLVTFNKHEYRITGYSVNTTATNAGTVDTNVVSAATPAVYDEAGNDVSGSFAITTKAGELKINQRIVTITSEGKTGEYNGSALTNENYTVTNAIPGNTTDITDIKTTGSQIYVGSSKNTITYKVLPAVADNYDIKLVEGDLVVNSRTAKYEITVTAGSAEETYTGQPVVVNDYTTNTLTFDNVTYTIEGLSVNATLTDVGDVETNVVGTAVIKDAAGKDVSGQFIVSRVAGAIVINPQPLTLTSATLTKEYDGDALTNGSTALATETGWVNGEGATYAFGASQTIVGTTSNTFNIIPNAGTKMSNYDLTKTEGSLNVTNRNAQYQVTITAKSSTGNTYNGTAVTVDTFQGQDKATDRIPVEASNGKTYYVADAVAYGTLTNAGTETVAVSGTPKVFDAATGGNNVTDQFAVTMNPGSITIAPSAITLTGNDIEKKYTGKAVVPTMEDVTIGGTFYGNDGIESMTFSGSRTLVGTSPYEITSYTFKAGTIASNYTVTKSGGNITVIDNDAVHYDITISGLATGDGVEVEREYNGEPLVVSGYKVNGEVPNTTFGNWVANHITATGFVESSFTLTSADGNEETFVVSIPKDKVTATQTDVGTATYKWEKKDIKIYNGNQEVTNEFMIQLSGGSATVTPKEVIITSATDNEIPYDGEAHQLTTVTTTGVLDKDVGEVTFLVNGFPSVTDVGDYESNTFNIVGKTGSKAKNYTAKGVYGTISIVDRDESDRLDSTTIYAKNGGGTYDGTTQTVSGWQNEVNNKIAFTRANGMVYYVDVTDFAVGATGTNVSDSKDTVVSGTYHILDGKGKDVTKQFKPVTTVMGRLEITPVALTITSASGEQEYNGNIYRLDEASVTNGAFVGEEGATYTFTGGRYRIGSTKNTFEYALKPGTLAENYNITKVEGALNVINRNAQYNVTLVAKSDSTKYDGKTYAINGFKAGVDEDTTKEGIQMTVDGNVYTITGMSAQATGKNATDEAIPVNVLGEPKVVDADNNDVTANFAVHTTAGTLAITKRDVTVASPDKTYVYDGQPHGITDDEIVVGGDGFVAGEGLNYNKTTITLVGTKSNAFTYTMAGATLASNYNITKTEGTLTVTENGADTEQIIDKVIDDSTKIYDEGDEVTYTITATNIYDTPQDITISEQAGVTLDQSTFTNVAPGESVVAHATYTITAADISAGAYENTATVTFPALDKSFSDTEGSAALAEEGASVILTKRLTAVNGEAVTPGEQVIVKVGDELTYTINAINNGNVDLRNVEINDILTGESWTVATLAARTTSADYNTVYTVTQADAVAGTVHNTATVETTGDDDNLDPTDPTDDADVDVTVDQNFTVTIHFVNLVGETVYPDYVGTYKVGDTFTIVSPEVTGYTPSVASIASPEGGMPAQDIVLTVIYNAVPETPEATTTTPTTTGGGTTPAGGAGGEAGAGGAGDVGAGAGVADAGAGAGDAGNLIAVEENQTPLAQIQVDGNGDISLIPVDDLAIPLANSGLGFLFNALYFLLLFAAMLTIIGYCESMKKHQLRIQDYEKQLGKRK